MIVVVCVTAASEELGPCDCRPPCLLFCSVQRLSIRPRAVRDGWEVRSSQIRGEPQWKADGDRYSGRI